MLQPQRARSGRTAQERFGCWTQADEGDLRRRTRADTARGSAIGLRQVTERHFAWTHRVVADDLGASVVDDHLVVLGQHVDPLADQRLRHKVPTGAEANTAAFLHLALLGRA